MASFEFATAARIVFGWGRIRELPRMARELGERALIVTGRDSQRASGLVKALHEEGVASALFPVSGEPTVDQVRAGVQAAQSARFLIGFGGGSVIDAAKAIAALAPNSGEPLDYLEVVGRGLALENDPLPFIAVPTVAGTGAEVTRNAVLESPEHSIKASLRSPRMLAAIALVDPELTITLPPRITADSGLDALTQLIEPYVSSRANPLTDSFCKQGLMRLPEALETAFADGRNRPAREAMSLCSLLGGLALANAGLGVVHAIAGPLGALTHAPHGALCAALLPYGMQANIAALRQRAPTSEALHRYTEIAALLTGNGRAAPEEGALWVFALNQKLEAKPLSEYRLRPDQCEMLIKHAARASSMKANPIALSENELNGIFEQAQQQA